MNLAQLLDVLREDPCVTHWRTLPARQAQWRPFPPGLDPRLTGALQGLGITALYSHQAEAIRSALAGADTTVVTPTASGKTLCYNVPVLDAILKDEASRALYLFPTKALAQDQLAELRRLSEAAAPQIKVYTYDGDTEPAARSAIRAVGHIVVTNPDMLHTGILPHHTRWVRLFSSLKFVVVDELHQYRGVFGSHVANLLRRLQRVCRFYGSSPVFICASATIANPGELASRLLGREARVVDENGAPSGEKHFVFYNPPVVNRSLGIRRSSTLEARRLAAGFLKAGVRTIVFARSRIVTEVLLSYLKADAGPAAGAVRGYRGGYLPKERREIERGLREGSVRAVVSTNALELGIDIGGLDAAVLAGYPGSIASTWQQAGRAGRRTDTSVAVLVASSSALDQFVVTRPDYFFRKSPEHGLVNPDNLYILMSHLKCAAFELPFADGEEFGVSTTPALLEFLGEEGVLRRTGDRWHWMSASFPAEEISLRSASAENVVIIDTTRGARVIGEVDRFSAPMLVHEDAIYLHEGRQFHVDKLDWAEGKAYVRPVDVDYYTDAELSVDLKVLACNKEAARPAATHGWGDVRVNALVPMYKKVKLHTHENIGSGRVHLPESELHTTAYWAAVSEEALEGLSKPELQGALSGLANLLANIAPLYLLCDRRDIRVVPQLKSPFTGLPTVFCYDAYPGGTGLSERLFSLAPAVLAAAADLLAGCQCEAGCPSCVGPAITAGPAPKQAAGLLLKLLGEGDGHGLSG